MDLEGVVLNGVIVLDDAQAPAEGTRVRIEPLQVAEPATFGQLFGDLAIDSPDLPTDLAAQHDHYRLGKPARTPAEILADIAALPLHEGPVFSGRDHDRVLYGAGKSS